MTFAELGLSAQLLQAVTDAGYTEPTPIQAAAIPYALQGRDVLGVAQTGTGKTAGFTLPMIEMLSRGRAKARMPRSLILEPTRELAMQVAESFDKYGKNHKLTKALLIGGVSFGDQDRLLTQGVDVLIATPGRLLDHFERGKLLMNGVQILVIDEADRMLDMGFIDDIERIFKLTPFTRQTLFFSATMPPEITRLTEQFLHNPQRVEVSRPATTGENITQRILKIPSNDARVKRAALRAAIDSCDINTAIVFCNRKTEVDVVAKSLQKHGYKAAPIHGDLEQRVRIATLAKFKAGEINILVASDVAARGLDIPDVTHVFNYNVPRHADDYVHRIGRTGRAGRKGDAITIVSPEDRKSIAAVEALTKQTIGVADIAVPDVDTSAPARERASSDRPSRDRSRRSKAPREQAAPREPAPPREEAAAAHVSRPEAEQEEAPASARSSRSRRSRPRPVPVPVMEAAAPPVTEERVRRESKPAKPRTAEPAPSNASRREPRDRREQAFGDHTPAFLLRAAPVQK